MAEGLFLACVWGGRERQPCGYTFLPSSYDAWRPGSQDLANDLQSEGDFEVPAVSVSWFLEWVFAGILSVLVETQVGLPLSILHPGLAKRAVLSRSEISEFTFYVKGVQKSIPGVWLS